MIPKPPYAKDLTPEQEIAEVPAAEAPASPAVWDAAHHARGGGPHTAVVVPSLTLDQSELRRSRG